MRAVLDTNVLVSALVTKGGTCARILDLATQRAFTPCVDDRMVVEYEDVLRRPRLHIEPEEREGALELFRAVGMRVRAMPLRVVLPDADDLPFLEVAVAVDAVLVTGNKRHFPRAACGDVSVLTPAEFLDLLAKAR